MQKTDLKVYVLPYSAKMEFFQYTSVPILQRVYTERIEPNLPFYVDFMENAGEYFFLHNIR